jgi:tetratricopeptide (TPR) repeat protein
MRIRNDFALRTLLSLAIALPGASFAQSGSLASANADLQAGRADAAIAKLNDALKADPKSAEANNLLCRVELTLDQFDQAAEHCQKAVEANPQSAKYHLWLGQAIGERASKASAFSAFSLAKKSRAEFEEAVRLDPKDAEALADLGEFYKEAPGVVGGGTDKAEEIAKKLDSVSPSRAHVLRGTIAEKQKDFPGAEKEYKAATAGDKDAQAWIELANFYRRQSRWADMESAVNSGVAAAAHSKHGAVALFNGASTLARTNRQLPQAIKLYESYLASPDKTEEAPAFDALTRLAKLRNQTGDAAGAKRDRDAALALAHEYKPAIEAKF